MKRLPQIRIVPVPIGRRRALSCWLYERSVDLALREEGGGKKKCRGAGRVGDAEPVECGQIRLLHPWAGGGEDRLHHVLVLEKHGDGAWLVAPFGPYAEPAVPGELKSGLRAPALRVLSVWNAFALRPSRLERSWVVDRMPANAMARVQEVYRSLSEGSDLPVRLVRRVGPPLVHPGDPRIDYLDEEREWCSALGGARAVGAGALKLWIASELPGQQRDLAADRRDRYRSARERRRKDSKPPQGRAHPSS